MARNANLTTYAFVNGANGHTAYNLNGVGALQNGSTAVTSMILPNRSHVNGGNVNGLSNGDAVHAHTTTTNGHNSNGVPTNVALAGDAIATPMVICGMALRLPGGLRTPQNFWRFLLNIGDARCRVPKSGLDIDAYYAPGKKPAHIGTEYGFFLDDSVDLSMLDT